MSENPNRRYTIHFGGAMMAYVIVLFASVWILERYEIGGGLHGVAADENAIWSSARERERVVRIDRASGKRMEADIGPEPYHMASVSGAILVSSASDNVLWVVDPVTLNLRKTIATEAAGHQFVEMN